MIFSVSSATARFNLSLRCFQNVFRRTFWMVSKNQRGEELPGFFRSAHVRRFAKYKRITSKLQRRWYEHPCADHTGNFRTGIAAAQDHAASCPCSFPTYPLQLPLHDVRHLAHPRDKATLAF